MPSRRSAVMDRNAVADTGVATAPPVPAPRPVPGWAGRQPRTRVRIRIEPRLPATGGDAIVVAVAGEIDLGSIGTVRAALTDALARHRRVVADLSGVRFMGSTGLNELVRAHRRAEAARGRLFVVSGVGNRRVLRPVHAAGLGDHLHVHDTLESALRA